ncbi:type II secretion system protein [Photobacterium chitinilyticum]|uniref:Type II secretion system protein n=1 Tax=Photobacterium chitinilyticum TaxID=2485123 RepID=A0A444JNK4_9GAMM|nr:type II secretion system protein [Photobacterium chitinilyticum]RWX54661.1 type II secretion system protein [Photobacterium chitinilyticum]
MRFQRGFTLIELVVVIVLLGILAVTAAPRFLNVQDDAKDSTYLSLKGSFHSAVELFHSKWLVDGEPDPNISEGREGDWGYTIYDLHFNESGYPRIINTVQSCEDILENLLPGSSLTRDDYEKPVPTGDGLNGNMCTFKFISAPYNLTYSETNGDVTLSKRT